jgi:hypothetical protein
MKTRKSELLGKQVMLEGLMAFGKLENGQRTIDFECCEDVVAEAFCGTFKVQVMRDGNVYMTEKVKHPKNDPLFRDDNCSFSHGRNRKYYFVFTLDDDRIDELPYLLTRQSGIIAQKVLRKILCDKEVMQ